MSDKAYQKCINPDCAAAYDLGQRLNACPKCHNLLDAWYDWDRLPVPKSLKEFEARWSTRSNPLDFSGVWRFRDLMPFANLNKVITIGEGQTLLRPARNTEKFIGLGQDKLRLQYEGLNPSGSFKDNGMTGAFTHAAMVGAKIAACASTGNTSASVAAFAAASGLVRAVILVGSGKIAFGKLSQALDFGALTLQVLGDFDDAMARVAEISDERGIYLMNSVNPFRLEGQKATMFRILEGMGWEPPDWIIAPGGNLGNSSAFGKAFMELRDLGLVKRVPRLAVINSTGADTLYRIVNQEKLTWNQGRVDDEKIKDFYARMDAEGRKAKTLASAIEINRPVNLKKCLRALDVMRGEVRAVEDQAIVDAKAVVGSDGIGCEPASAASVAGARLLRQEGVIGRDETVVCVLTGHQLKDPNVTVGYHASEGAAFDEKFAPYGVSLTPYRNFPIQVPNDIEQLLAVLDKRL